MKRFQQLYRVALTRKKMHEIIFVLMAFEAVFAFSSLGYLDFPSISTTTLHILVIVSAMILGAEGSVPVACVFAFTSMWIASYPSYATSTFDQLFSPVASGAPVRSLMLGLARVLFAMVSSWIFGLYFRKPRSHIYLGIAAIAVLSTFLHGALVLAAYELFFPAACQELIPDIFVLPLFRDWFSYASAAFVCCFVHSVLSGQTVRDHLAYLCENAAPARKNGYQKSLIFADISVSIIVILCVMYARKRVFSELQFQGIELPRSSYLSITAFSVQLIFAFVCLFGIAIIVIRWINEFYTVRQSQMDKTLTEQSVKISIDALTGVFSRFAYHDAIEFYADQIPDDFAVFLMDINGLKTVNDTSGHEAGDELVCGAARCITEAVGDRGKTFRIGGDEFVVFGSMNRAQAEETLVQLSRITASWSGRKVKSLSISAGYALAHDFAGYSVENLVREADRAMYQQKKEYYQKKKTARSR